MKMFNNLSVSVLLVSLIGPFGLTGLAIAGEDEQSEACGQPMQNVGGASLR